MKNNKVNIKKELIVYIKPLTAYHNHHMVVCVMQREENKQATFSNVPTFYDNEAYTKRPTLSF